MGSVWYNTGTYGIQLVGTAYVVYLHLLIFRASKPFAHILIIVPRSYATFTHTSHLPIFNGRLRFICGFSNYSQILCVLLADYNYNYKIFCLSMMPENQRHASDLPKSHMPWDHPWFAWANNHQPSNHLSKALFGGNQHGLHYKIWHISCVCNCKRQKKKKKFIVKTIRLSIS